jgi:hypothetical protein
MAELDFSNLEDLTTKIEGSGNEAAKVELKEARKANNRSVYEAAASGNDALITDNDLAIAEDDLERIIMAHHLQ